MTNEVYNPYIEVFKVIQHVNLLGIKNYETLTMTSLLEHCTILYLQIFIC